MKQTNQARNRIDTMFSFVSLSLNTNNILELLQESSIVLCDIVTSTWMMSTVIGWFPLMKIVLWSCIVVMMVVHSLSDFPVTESNAAWQSSEVSELDSILLENLQNLLSVSVVLFQEFLFLESWVVAFVGDRPWVVVTVEGSVLHDSRSIFLINFITN